MPLLQEVQNLEESRDRLVLSFDDGRQSLFLGDLQNESCTAEVRIHFGIEDRDGIVKVITLARNVCTRRIAEKTLGCVLELSPCPWVGLLQTWYRGLTPDKRPKGPCCSWTGVEREAG
jgi:hypothetical protein